MDAYREPLDELKGAPRNGGEVESSWSYIRGNMWCRLFLSVRVILRGLKVSTSSGSKI
jgi:hypothetical protein